VLAALSCPQAGVATSAARAIEASPQDPRPPICWPKMSPTEPLFKGAELIKDQVRRLPDAPGVYRMVGEDGEVLYVGKARSLKKRVGQ